MKTLKLSLAKIYNEDTITVNIIMGTLYGYSYPSIQFFLDGKLDGGSGLPCITKYNISSIATYEEFSTSGFSGTGYISYPKEIRDISDNKITIEEVIKGINERRLITTDFPDEGKEDGYIFLDLNKLKGKEVTTFKKYEV